MRKFILLLVGLLALCGGAEAGSSARMVLLRAAQVSAVVPVWGTATVLNSTATNSQATATSIPAGTLLVETGGGQAAATGNAITVTDTHSLTWTTFYIYRGATTNFCFGAWAVNGSTLGSGTTATIFNAGTQTFTNVAASLIKQTGQAASAPEDTSTRGSNSGGATPSPTVTSGSPAAANEWLISDYDASSTNLGTYTEDASWTNLVNKNGNTSIMNSVAALVNTGTGTKTHAPTTTSQAYCQILMGFKHS